MFTYSTLPVRILNEAYPCLEADPEASVAAGLAELVQFAVLVEPAVDLASAAPAELAALAAAAPVLVGGPAAAAVA